MKILTLFALEEETQGLFKDVRVVYTGVGKVNACYSVVKEIYKNRPDVVLNFGTAGSKVFNYGSLVLCKKFIQRDMNATVFGYDLFQTPSDLLPKVIDFNTTPVDGLFKNYGICGTGDSFETQIIGKEEYNVVEMEAYSYAKVCKIENIPFVCVKFISDGADGNAPKIWNDSLKIGAEKMRKAYGDVVNQLKLS